MSNVQFPRKDAIRIADLTVAVDDAIEKLREAVETLRIYMIGGLNPDSNEGFIVEALNDAPLTIAATCRHSTPVGDYCRWCAESPEG